MQGSPQDSDCEVGETSLGDDRIDDLLRIAHRARDRAQLPEIPGYVLERRLGRGSSGVVYLARQTAVGNRRVALKVLPEGALWSDSMRRRFDKEVRALARLGHPGTVTIHDVVDDGPLAIAMEFVDGMPLDELIAALGESGTPSLDAVAHALDPTGAAALEDRDFFRFVARIGTETAWALSAVHAAGLLHRDVKPSNLIVKTDGSIVVTDFGLACGTVETDSLRTHHLGFVGTPAYAAPEQLLGNSPGLNAASDVYSLGVTLYELASLRRPYAGCTLTEAVRAVQHERAPPLSRLRPGIPRDLETIVAHAMEPDPERRYQTAAELADDLERFCSGRAIRVKRPGPLRRALRLARRNRRTLAAAVIGGTVSTASALVIALNLLWVPRYVEAQVREAREYILHPAFLDLELATRPGFVTMEGYVREHLFVGEWDPAVRYARAIDSYDRALRFRPGLEDIVLERRAVELALDLWLHRESQTVDPASLLDGYIEQAGDLAFTQEGGATLPASVGSQAEWRALGLLAFLCADVPTCQAAWDKLDVGVGESPMVDTMKGLLALLSEKPVEASLHIHAASRALPRVGWLAVASANAALRAGMVGEARLLLERAQRAPNHDHYHSLEQALGDLAALEGETERAAEWYSPVVALHVGEAARRHLARLLELDGRYGEALRTYTPLAHGGSERKQRQIRVRAGHAAIAWWDSLSAPDRVSLLAQQLGEPMLGRSQRPSLLQAGDWAREASTSPLVDEYYDSFELQLTASRPAQEVAQPRTWPRLDASTYGLSLPESWRCPLSDSSRRVLAAVALRLDRQVPGRRSPGNDSAVSTPLARVTMGLTVLALRGLDASRERELDPYEIERLQGEKELPISASSMTALPDMDGDGCCELAFGFARQVGAASTIRVVTQNGRTLWSSVGLDPGWKNLILTVEERAEGLTPRLIAVGALEVDPGSLQVRILDAGDGRIVDERVFDSWGLGYQVAALPSRQANEETILAMAAIERDSTRHAPGPGAVTLYPGLHGEPRWRSAGESRGAGFGREIAFVGDANGDGELDLAVSAPQEMGRGQGRVYLLSGIDGTPLASFAPYEPLAKHFGAELTAIADQDGDGIQEVAVSATGWGTRLPEYVYLLSGATLDLIWRSDPRIGDTSGHSILSWTDVDGDGVSDIAVGATQAVKVGTGYVAVLSGSSGVTIGRIQGQKRGVRFAGSLAGGGSWDWDGDGVADLAVSVDGDDAMGTNTGSVRIYSGAAFRESLEQADTPLFPTRDVSRTTASPGERPEVKR